MDDDAASAAARLERGVRPHLPQPFEPGTRAMDDAASTASTPVLSSQEDGSAQAWQRIGQLQRQLKAAIEKEDYSVAAKLRDEQQVLSAGLPPLLQYNLHHAVKLRSGTLGEQREAIAALGKAGDEVVLPDLAACLTSRELHEAAQAAMWSIFMRSRDPRVNELMEQGCKLMASPLNYEKALATFDQVVMMQPSFAEGYNKRATMLYLMCSYEQSIQDCKIVLQMQPYHFGAASGLGLNYMHLGRDEEAVQAFERALQINPYLTHVIPLLAQLRRKLKEGL